MKLYILPFLLFIIHSIGLTGQPDELVNKSQHIIALKNGSHLIGIIEAYAQDQPAVLIIGDGSKITIPYDQIESISPIQQKFKKSKIKKSTERPYAFEKDKLHQSLSFGLIDTDQQFGASGIGLFVDMNATYQIHRLFNVGLGIGFNDYNRSTGAGFIPIHISINGYVLPKHSTFFYAIDIGYGINIDRPIRDEWFQTNTTGGLYVSPRLGLRITGHQGTNMTIFSGLKIQKSSYEQRWGEDFEESILQDRIYQRLIFGVGFIF